MNINKLTSAISQVVLIKVDSAYATVEINPSHRQGLQSVGIKWKNQNLKYSTMAPRYAYL